MVRKVAKSHLEQRNLAQADGQALRRVDDAKSDVSLFGEVSRRLPL